MSAALTAYLLAVLCMFMAMVCMAFMVDCIMRRLYMLAVGFMGYVAVCLFCCLIVIEL